ncbi:DNA sulfur modification protein DndB [Crossiella sp. SN42]|uniref:DNA sulfur modification protein DndB n=1 Tax=Crossiella sp. SN42 TaxID=2944808 RepID=UPI00207C6961|nr:DNA sulfur modification protein DndB [Crossiella sp. SN42]MCO1576361.1 DNA sulfur modification protein DndB [Crossiella sp. SN42]
MTRSIFESDTEPIEHASIQAAMDAANAAAAASGGRAFPCTVFRQGQRLMLSTSFPLAFVRRHVQPDSAIKGSSPRGATNRPLIPDHVRSIRDYLSANPSQYILPPVTLNVRRLPALHIPKGNFAVRIGYMVVDDTTIFHVTDGQHRIAAIAGHRTGKSPTPGLLDGEDGTFHNDGLAVLIVVEPELPRIHQDFADAAQTKQIPASLLAVYNTREPVNRVLTSIVDRCSLFRDRIDETSKTLPKLSQSIFLLNQVRGLVKELLFRDYALSEDNLSRRAPAVIGTEEQQEVFIAQAVQLIETLTANMHPWSEIAKIPTAGGEANKIPDFRSSHVNMTATGLVIIGRVAWEINKLSSEQERVAKYVELAQAIDWRRDAPIWDGNVVAAGGKIVTLRGPVDTAARKVMAQLGISSELPL